MSAARVIDEPRAMQLWADSEISSGRRIALVPTMGALHAGHRALIRVAREHAESVVVSIFVNPIQFDRRDDFERYPRTLEADRAICAEEGAHAVYLPAAAAMYPEGFQTSVGVGPLTEPLCGAARPGHFVGVTTVVTKLFHAVRPQVAVFGQKDWQQLVIVRRMAADLDFGVDIVGVPTVREPDGLALSSRNARLSPEERRAACCIPRALEAAAAAVMGGQTDGPAVLDRVRTTIAGEPHARLEYAELRDPHTLAEVPSVTLPTLLALAVWVGGVRLIDNRILAPGGQGR